MQMRLIAVLTLAGLIGCAHSSSPMPDPAQQERLAECLTAKGVTLYSIPGCPACRMQKKAFGSAWKKLRIVMCEDEIGATNLACQQRNIDTFPTWVFPAQHAIGIGYAELDQLAAASDCPLK
jgi:glutaredoxin